MLVTLVAAAKFAQPVLPIKMRSLAVLLTLTIASPSLAFQPSHRSQTRLLSSRVPAGRRTPLGVLQASGKKEEYKRLAPATSFGSEIVPEEQRPVNEYLDITRQPMFGWANEESGSKGLLTRLLITYSVVFATVCYPISGATYTEDGFLLQKLAASNVGALLFILCILLRIYSGWGYLATRLNSKTIEYEETGWYDGDFELKPEMERKRDKFLYNSEVQPVVERLKAFMFATGGLCIVSLVSLNFAMEDKPIFNEYDPNVLERVRYDDNLAEQAASSSGGRPTYCDNRYYRAVAGGGQGCN